MMFILPYVLQPIILGFIAQRIFGRVGVFWAIFALAISVLLSIFLDHAITSQPAWILDPEYRRSRSTVGHDIAFLLMSVGVSSIVTLIILATLPKRVDEKSRAPQNGLNRAPASRSEELERLVSLKERGVLTEEEFQSEKRKLLATVDA